MDIENDHTSSAHLDTRTSNPSNSERFEFDGQADSRDGLEAFKMIDFRKATARPYSSMIQRRVRIDSENAPAVQ